MVVTDCWAKVVVVTCFIMVLMVGCGVDNVGTTPGAIVCNPTPGEVATFKNSTFTGFSVCTSCHGDNPANAYKPSRFRLRVQNATDNDYKNNLCVAYGFGQMSPSRDLITHPQDPKHGGGVFSPTSSEMTILIDWVQNYRLPSQK